MFGLGSPSLTLLLNGSKVRFRSTTEFEFALSGRTSIPADKISRLVSMSDGDLLREAEGIRKLEKRFSEILSAAMQASAEVGPILKALDMSLVTQDNDWRQVIESLNEQSARLEDFKRLALVKYMQYLRARQDVIRTLYSQRQRDRAEAATQVLGSEAGSSKMRETLIFDLSDEVPDETKEGGMRRLPKGETRTVHLGPGETMPLMLVRHACQILDEGGLLFVDDTANRTRLEVGRHAVGRDADCEIPLHPEYRDISRKHLIIEVVADRTLRLTDVSSLGTFINAEFLKRAS